MQWILLNLVFLESEDDPPTPVTSASPWMGLRLTPIDHVIGTLEAQRHRRVIKSHLPLDGLPYHPQVRYVVVARDARDVFMSLWNHYRSYTPEALTEMNTGQVGDPLPTCPNDIHVAWRDWFTRGWFPWESEGYPFWGNLHHTATWWEHRYLPNILFVHYNDLLADPSHEIRRVANHLGIRVDDRDVAEVAEATSFRRMKSGAERFAPAAGRIFRGGAKTFFQGGGNGRWREVVTTEDLHLYRAALERLLTPECAAWLEHGWSGRRQTRDEPD